MEFLEPFSSEKGSKPRGSDWSEATTRGEAADSARSAAKRDSKRERGLGENKSFPPAFVLDLSNTNVRLVREEIRL